MATLFLEDGKKIGLQLEYAAAPNTVRNFCFLAARGFYDGLKIYRVVKNFVIQAGCPHNNGKGTAGFCIPGEFAANGWDNPLKNTRGAVGLGRVADYNSGSCQFYIALADLPHLDGKYAVFGRVTEGMAVVDAISLLETDAEQHALHPPAISGVSLNKNERQWAKEPRIMMPETSY